MTIKIFNHNYKLKAHRQ